MTVDVTGAVLRQFGGTAVLRWSQLERGASVDVLETSNCSIARLEFDGRCGRVQTFSGEWIIRPADGGGFAVTETATGGPLAHLGSPTWLGHRVLSTPDGRRYVWEPATCLRRTWRFRADGVGVVTLHRSQGCHNGSVVVPQAAESSGERLAHTW